MVFSFKSQFCRVDAQWGPMSVGEGWWIGPVVAVGQEGGGGGFLYGEVQCIKGNGHMVPHSPCEQTGTIEIISLK